MISAQNFILNKQLNDYIVIKTKQQNKNKKIDWQSIMCNCKHAVIHILTYISINVYVKYV